MISAGPSRIGHRRALRQPGDGRRRPALRQPRDLGQRRAGAAANGVMWYVAWCPSSSRAHRPARRTGSSAAGRSSSATRAGAHRTSSQLLAYAGAAMERLRGAWRHFARRDILTDAGSAVPIEEILRKDLLLPATACHAAAPPAERDQRLAGCRWQAAHRRPARHHLVAWPRAAKPRGGVRPQPDALRPGPHRPGTYGRPRRPHGRHGRQRSRRATPSLGPLVRPSARRSRDDPPDRRRCLATLLRTAVGAQRRGPRLGRPQPLRPHEVQPVVFRAAARVRRAVRTEGSAPCQRDVFSAQPPRGGRALG